MYSPHRLEDGDGTWDFRPNNEPYRPAYYIAYYECVSGRVLLTFVMRTDQDISYFLTLVLPVFGRNQCAEYFAEFL